MAVKYVVKRRRNPRDWIESVPGLPKETYLAYGGFENWTPKRKALHMKILSMLLRNCKRTSHPQAILMMGGPASGKSTALNVLGIKTGYTTIDADAVKGELPEYRQAVEASARNAAEMVHEESSWVADVAFQRAITRRCNVIWDGTGKNSVKYAKLIDLLHSLGYTVRLIYVHVDPAVAIPRAVSRADRSGRWVPEYVIAEAYSKIPYNFPALANRADAWSMFDTTEVPARFVAEKQQGQAPQIYRGDLFAQYLEKFGGSSILKLQNPARRVLRHNPAPIDARAVEQALTKWVKSGQDDGETGL